MKGTSFWGIVLGEAGAVTNAQCRPKRMPWCTRDGLELESSRGMLLRMQLKRQELFLSVFRGDL